MAPDQAFYARVCTNLNGRADLTWVDGNPVPVQVAEGATGFGSQTRGAYGTYEPLASPKIASIAVAAEVISSAIWCRYTALVTVELM